MRLDQTILGIIATAVATIYASSAAASSTHDSNPSNDDQTQFSIPKIGADDDTPCNNALLSRFTRLYNGDTLMTHFEFTINKTHVNNNNNKNNNENENENEYSGRTPNRILSVSDNTSRFESTTDDGVFTVLHGNPVSSDAATLVYGVRSFLVKERSWRRKKDGYSVTEYRLCV
ncbi:MAG: hypothetical protein J3R72DRAFT_444954, partial [Linnemannia gamsii]